MVGRWGTGLCLGVGLNSGNHLLGSWDGAGNEPEPEPSKLITCGLDRVDEGGPRAALAIVCYVP